MEHYEVGSENGSAYDPYGGSGTEITLFKRWKAWPKEVLC